MAGWEPLREAAFALLMEIEGEAAIVEALSEPLRSGSEVRRFRLDEATPEDFDRMTNRLLSAIHVEHSPPMWRYEWSSQWDEEQREVTRVAPWDLPPDPPFPVAGDLNRAREVAVELWTHALDLVIERINDGSLTVEGRIGSITATFTKLEADQLHRLVIHPSTGDGAIEGLPVFALRVSDPSPAKLGRKRSHRDLVIEQLRSLWPDGAYPSHKEVDRALREEGVTVSMKTIQRALEEVRTK